MKMYELFYFVIDPFFLTFQNSKLIKEKTPTLYGGMESGEEEFNELISATASSITDSMSRFIWG